jgi:hypothetical protein
MVEEMDLIRELFHQEYTASSFHLNMILCGGIRDFVGVESASFIRDTQSYLVRFFAAGDYDIFVAVKPVAMLHGIVDSFCQADQDIGIQVRIYIQALDKVLHEVLDFANAARV